MFSTNKIIQENTSTPKRRRLGTGRILRSNLQYFDKDSNNLHSPISRASSLDKNDDDPLPCNQLEYLRYSGDSSSASNIPCSPGIFESFITKNIDNCDSLAVSKNQNNVIKDVSTSICKDVNDLKDISEEMFISKLEQERSQHNHVNNNNYNTLLTSRCEKNFIEQFEDSLTKKCREKSIYNLNPSTTICKELNGLEDISDEMFISRVEPESTQHNHDNKTLLISKSEIQCRELVDGSIMKKSREKSIYTNKSLIQCKEFDDVDDISDEMFISKLEQESSQRNHNNNTLLTSRCEKHFREHIEESFNVINKSICNLDNKADKIDEKDKSSLFESKDSFLLDIKESGLVLEEKETKCQAFTESKTVETKAPDKNSFYGLPMIAKGLFKSYRNIEKFYDWQEECLNLPAIKERRNLIYALPTSGGKTLVAEILMLREVLNRKQNALFILPFVAIVQEKMWSLSPFAVQLDFLIEEYAGGKGLVPPKKRRTKNSIYIATIEKGLALVRSLIELERLNELGLVIVDELHLIGEPGRGGTLETLLTTILFTKQDIQIVGMSATIGNLPDLAQFLHAEVFTREFRPVELTEYVKLGDMLHRLVWGPTGLEIVADRQLAFNYSASGASLDPDRLGGLVGEVVPDGSCLVFCPTKRNCQNVAWLLCRMQKREMTVHRTEERLMLERALRAEGAHGDLVRCVRFGVAYHHAGLASDERSLLEHAFRSGVISVLCCTSTLAAGVNLPARRVVVRAPRVGRSFLSLGGYRQMAGRAGRAGVCHAGESIIICEARDWSQLRSVLHGGLSPARSVLAAGTVGSLLLSAVALRLADNRPRLRALLDCTLLAKQSADNISPTDVKQLCDDTLRSLIKCGALEVTNKPTTDREATEDCVVYNDSDLVVSKLGRAAIVGCMELSVAKQLLLDLEVASRSLVLMGSLHLLYLVTPHDAAGVRPDYRHYYSLYCSLDEEGIQTAKVLGITEMNAIRMMTGRPITNVPETVLCRFYLALMLHDLWKQVPFPIVADKYNLPRGTVQSVMTTCASFAWSAHKLCEQLEPLWPFSALFEELAPRLQHCAVPELRQLLQLPAVHKARAMQLMRAGYKRIEDLAKASVEELASSVEHLSRKAANHLISAARMMLIEKVENLRAEAEDVMEELNV